MYKSDQRFSAEFKPEINKNSAKIVMQSGKTGDIVQKLFDKRVEYKQKLKERTESAKQKEVENCTFTPQLMNSKRPKSAQGKRPLSANNNIKKRPMSAQRKSLPSGSPNSV